MTTSDNFGILALEVYIPARYVDQVSLETFDSVSSGKYTVGLGQEKMAICDSCEDAVSMSMNGKRNVFLIL